MAEGGNRPATAGDYTEVHLSQHPIENGSITIGFLEQTPSERGTAHVPSWKTFMRNEVVQTTMKLVKKGWADSGAKFTFWVDSGMANGLALSLQIEGVEVSDDNKKNYQHRMKQFLKKMSKAVHVEVQTSRDESSRLGRQERRQVPTPTRNSRESHNEPGNATPHTNAVHYEELFQSGLVVIVTHLVSLKRGNRAIRLYEGEGRIPFAFFPDKYVSVNCLRSRIPVFTPDCSFLPYLIEMHHLPRHRMNWMIATPDLTGCVTGLIPFMFESNSERLYLAITHPWTKRVRIHPLETNPRFPASPRNQAGGASPSTSSASNSPSFGPRIENSCENFPPLPHGRAEEVNENLNMDMRALSLNTPETSNLAHQLSTTAEATFRAPSTDDNNNEKK